MWMSGIWWVLVEFMEVTNNDVKPFVIVCNKSNQKYYQYTPLISSVLIWVKFLLFSSKYLF